MPKPGDNAQDCDVEDIEYYVEVTDDFYCEYDSTWETNTSGNEKSSSYRSYTFQNFRRAARDMQNYRQDYPNLITQCSASWYQQEDDMPNLKFYLGQRTSCPDGYYIDDFHKNWFGDYTRLERVHTFIQWLFPLQEPGMNYQAIELTKEEIQAFLENQTAKDNLLKSYKLMLDFYGIELSNEKTGEVKRAHNWQERFKNLDRNTHNNLRITRILKCLGTLGYPHYQAPLVYFFLEETLIHSQLYYIKESVLNYFMFTVLNKQQRRELIKYAFQHFGQGEFVWCPKRIQNIWSEETGNHECSPEHEETTQNKSVSKQKTRMLPQGGTNSDDDQDSVTPPHAQPNHQGCNEEDNKQRELGDRNKDDNSTAPRLTNDNLSQTDDNVADLKDGDWLPEKDKTEDSANSSTGQVPLLHTCTDERSNTSPTEPSETEWTASGTDEGVSTKKSTSENKTTFMPHDILPEKDKHINTEVSGEGLEDSVNNSTGHVPLLPTCTDERSNTSPTEPSETEWTASNTDEGVSTKNGTSENKTTFMPCDCDMSDQQMTSKTSVIFKRQVTETSENEAIEQVQNSDRSREESDNRLEDSDDNSSTGGPQKTQIQTYTDENSNATPL